MKLNNFSLIMFFLFFSFTVFADELLVSNRQPNSGEVNYFPSDDEQCKVNPPGFVWLPEDKADSYIVQCSSQNDFSQIEYQAEDITLNLHCPPNLFKPGTWYWRYAYKTKAGESSNWSQTRTFTIENDATHFPMPTLTDLLERLPTHHPKLFLRPETLEKRWIYITFNFSQQWENFLADMDEEIHAPLVTEEPPPYPSGGEFKSSNKADVDVWRNNRSIVVPEVERAANLAFAYLLTSNEKYGKRAKEIVMAVMQWDPHGTTGWKMNDEIAMPVLSCVSRVFTWAQGSFTKEERDIVIQIMTERARDAYEHLIRTQHTVRPYGSHNNRSWHFLGETAIAFMDDIPEAKTWLKYAMDVFFCLYPVWSDTDGGWHEGIAYWNSYLSRVTWWLDIIETAFDIDGFKKPFFKNAGDFPVYVNPLESEFAGFGDMADTHSWQKNQDLMRYFAYKTRNQFWSFYGSFGIDKSTPQKNTYYDLLRFRADMPPGKPISGMAPSKIFEDTGIASLHSYLGMNNLDTHFLFKSSPFGSQSHGFNAQNSFILSHEGLPVLHWSGHRDWHGSDHHKDWMWETKSDNSITVNGKGQIKHSSEAKGKIIQQYLSDNVDYIAGDASKAYGDRLTKFIRHVIFVKPDMVFLVDELEAPEPSTFEYHLHASEEFSIENQNIIRATNKTSGVRLAISAPNNLDVTQTSEMSPSPVNWDKQQWHLTASTPEKSTKQTFVSLMKTFGEGMMSKMDVNTYDFENVDTYGYSINDDKILMLLINDSQEIYTMQDTRSDAFITVLYANIKLGEMMMFAVDTSLISIAGETMLQSEKRTNFQVPEEKLKKVFVQYNQNAPKNN